MVRAAPAPWEIRSEIPVMDVNRKIVSSSAPVFSYWVEVENIGEEIVEFAVPLAGDQRQALRAALGLQAIESWTATAKLYRQPDEPGVLLHVKFAADVVQSCVVTLEPVRNRVEHSFTNLYVPEAQVDAAREELATEVVIDIEDSDLPYVLTEAGVDVGEAIAEQLALVIDPYPRKRGARLQPDVGHDFAGDGGSTKKDGPFAALGSLHAGN